MAKQSTFNISLRLLTQEFNKGITNIQRQLKSFGNFVKGAFGLTALVTFGRKVIETGAQFEDAMARVQAVSNATASEMSLMTKEAEKLGATTKYSASEAANALENLTRNGMSATDATSSLATVLKLAQANAIGLSEAADIVSNTLNMFGLQAKDAEKVSDVLSATAANSATNITLLNEALVNAAPVAKTLGMSIEETSSMIGALAQRGLKGAAAGTQLRMALIKMVDPSVTKKLKEYGIEIDESTIKSEGLVGVLKRVRDANLNMTQLTDIFKSRQAAGIQQMIDSYDDLVKIMNVTENAAGTTARMFKQGVGSTEEAIKSLKSAYEGFLNSIFKRTSSAFNSVIKGLTNIVRALTDTKTRTVAAIGAITSALTIKLVKAMQKVRVEAAATAVRMTVLKTAITTVTAAAKAAYAAMGGWVGILVTLGSVVLTSVVSTTQRAKEETRDLAKAEADAAAEAQTEAVKLQRLHRIAEDMTVPIENRTRALEEMKRIAPGYLGTLDKEGRLINDNKEALDKYIESLQASLILKAREAHLTDLMRRKEEELQKAYEIETAGPTAWDKAQSALSGRTPITAPGSAANPGTPSYMSPDDFVRDRAKKHYDKADEYQKEIEQYAEKKIDEAYQNYLNTNTTPDGGGGGGGGDTTKAKDTPDTDFTKAQKEYVDAIEKATLRFESNASTQEEFIQEQASAYKAFIDAYIDYAAATGRYKALEGEEFQNLLQAYNNLIGQTNALALQRKAEKEKEEKQNEAWKKLDEGLSRLGSKQGKNSVQNPWDNFSSNPKEYRDEEREVQRLQTELENLVSTYESLKDVMDNIGEPQNEKQIESLKKWNALLAEINEKTAEYQQKANALGSKKAMDEINEKTIDQRRAYYDTIRNTTSAVGQLASNLQSLADADWGTMSIAEKFNTISNAIFGTIDAVLNVIDTFRSLQEIIQSLQAAKTAYAAIEEAASKQEIKNAEEIGPAVLAKGAAELAASKMSATAAEVDKESKRGVVAANSATAISGAASAMASIPYVGPILATAAATEMEALLAAMLPKFANGGIIQGSSKYGDKLLARVNAGEAILNQRQQKRLLDIADGRAAAMSGEVRLVAHGKDLMGVWRNINNANSKISGAKGL